VHIQIYNIYSGFFSYFMDLSLQIPEEPELFSLVWLLLRSAVFCINEERFNSGNFAHKN